jgi:hypothetical protein
VISFLSTSWRGDLSRFLNIPKQTQKSVRIDKLDWFFLRECDCIRCEIRCGDQFRRAGSAIM